MWLAVHAQRGCPLYKKKTESKLVRFRLFHHTHNGIPSNHGTVINIFYLRLQCMQRIPTCPNAMGLFRPCIGAAMSSSVAPNASAKLARK
jgi:hypothetical protein